MTLKGLKVIYDTIKKYDKHANMGNNEAMQVLRSEYISLLPEDKQLAIRLHNKLCRLDCSRGLCSFYSEMGVLEDNWDAPAHKMYLDKAREELKEQEGTASEPQA